MKTIQFALNDEQARKLKALCALNGIKQSDLLMSITESFLDGEEQPTMHDILQERKEELFDKVYNLNMTVTSSRNTQIEAFLKEYGDIEEGLSTNKLYECYVEWCKLNDNKPYKITSLSRAVTKLGYYTEARPIDGKNARCYLRR